MAVRLATVAPVGFEEFPPDKWLVAYKRLGCTVVQVYRNQNADVSLGQIRETLEAGGMPCDSIHGLFGEEYDPSAPDEQARKFAVDTFRGDGELVKRLGGWLVVVHCSTIRREGISADERKNRVEQLKHSIDELGRFGESIGVKYAFENLPGYHPVGPDVGELAGIITEVAAPNTGICFDTGHANMVGDPAAMLAEAKGRLMYVHVSDNSGRGDEHLMPYHGTLDVQAVARTLREIGYDGTIMLEVFYSTEQLNELAEAGFADKLKQMLAIANGQS